MSINNKEKVSLSLLYKNKVNNNRFLFLWKLIIHCLHIRHKIWQHHRCKKRYKLDFCMSILKQTSENPLVYAYLPNLYNQVHNKLLQISFHKMNFQLSFKDIFWLCKNCIVELNDLLFIFEIEHGRKIYLFYHKTRSKKIFLFLNLKCLENIFYSIFLHLNILVCWSSSSLLSPSY